MNLMIMKILKTIKMIIKILEDIFSLFSLLNKKKNLVFFSESKHYSKYFKPLIIDLIKNDIEFIYICKNDDPLIGDLNKKNLKVFNFIFFLSNVFSIINCKYLVLTTPDIGKKRLKRSMLCEKIIYLFHSPVSTHMIYNEGAFDSFDTIFCIGSHQYYELDERFQEINKTVDLNKIGYPYLDYLRNQINIKKNYRVNTILIAPSWNSVNADYYKIYFKDLIKILLEKNYCVIFRPHPEFVKRYKQNYFDFISVFMNSNNFYIDENENSFEVQSKSEILISDWSGISFEFAFSFERPVIFIDTEKKILNQNYLKSKFSPIEISKRDEIGIIVEKENVSNILNYIDQLRQKKSFFESKIKKLRLEIVYNLDISVETIIRYFKKNI